MNFGAELTEVIEHFTFVTIPRSVPAEARGAAISFSGPVFLVVPSVIRTREADDMRAVEFQKYAGEDEYFTLDWDLRAVTADDPITDSSWNVPLPMIGSNFAYDATTTSAKISGGVAGRRYILLNTIKTQSGQTKVCQVNFVVS